MDAGVKVSADRVTSGTVVPRNLVYNTLVIDPRAPSPPAAPDYTLTSRHLTGMTARSATALAGLRVSGAQRFLDPTAPLKVRIDDLQFTLALLSNLSLPAGFLPSTSKSSLAIALEATAASNPALAAQLQLVPLHEAA